MRRVTRKVGSTGLNSFSPAPGAEASRVLSMTTMPGFSVASLQVKLSPQSLHAMAQVQIWLVPSLEKLGML